MLSKAQIGGNHLNRYSTSRSGITTTLDLSQEGWDVVLRIDVLTFLHRPGWRTVSFVFSLARMAWNSLPFLSGRSNILCKIETSPPTPKLLLLVQKCTSLWRCTNYRPCFNLGWLVILCEFEAPNGFFASFLTERHPSGFRCGISGILGPWPPETYRNSHSFSQLSPDGCFLSS